MRLTPTASVCAEAWGSRPCHTLAVWVLYLYWKRAYTGVAPVLVLVLNATICGMPEKVPGQQLRVGLLP